MPLDGSAHAELALDTAIEIARRCGAKLILVRVAGHPVTHFYVEATDVVAIPNDDSVRRYSTTYLAEISRKLDAEGITVNYSLVRAWRQQCTRPGQQSQSDRDCHPWPKRPGPVMLGSVAHRVSQGAHVPGVAGPPP